VAYLGSRVSAIPIRDAVDKLKVVRPDGSLVRTARALGICLGD
jgi:6-phosphofructokinase 1